VESLNYRLISRRIAASAGVVTVGALASVLLASPASAHVTVNPKEAVQGGYAKVAFRVPNEKDTANTVKLEVRLPADKPVGSVSLRPAAGWTAQTQKSKPIKVHGADLNEAITTIIWTADANSAIKPGQFQEFEVSLGPLPETDTMVFKALQTYSDGDVVRWIDEPAAGAEPEHPAPVLTLTPKAADSHGGPSAQPVAAANTSGDTGSGSGGAALELGIAGLVLGTAGLVAGLLAFRKASRTTA
jgi:periplasmic copper chaperone A